MTTRHRNPYAALVMLCHGDQRYGGERALQTELLYYSGAFASVEESV